jgi:hypothetical protein
MVSPMLLSSRNRHRPAFNIDGHVGLKAPNIDDDVALVQLAYHFRAKSGLGTPEEQRAALRIRPGDICSGNEDDPLVIAIRAHQKARGGTQDGRVSPVQGGGLYVDAGGSHTYMLTALVNNIADGCPEIYPRLDKLGELCPSALAEAVIDACVIPPKVG